MKDKIKVDDKIRNLVKEALEEIINKFPKGYAVTTGQLEKYVYNYKNIKDNDYIKQTPGYINLMIARFIIDNKLQKMNESILIDNIEDVFNNDKHLPSGRKIVIIN